VIVEHVYYGVTCIEGIELATRTSAVIATVTIYRMLFVMASPSSSPSSSLLLRRLRRLLRLLRLIILEASLVKDESSEEKSLGG
jgi:hypothetical protein